MWPFSTGQQQPNAMTLGVGGAAPSQMNGYMMGAGGGLPTAQQQWGQQQQPMWGQQQQQWGQQPMPQISEMEAIAMLMQSNEPVNAWLASPTFQQFIGMLATLTNLCLVEFFRAARFGEDNDGRLCVDMTSLPSQYQTLSGENVTSDLNNIQAQATQKVQEGVMRQQQTISMVNQGMMQGMLGDAMANPGMMESLGSTVGGLTRGLMGVRV
jgi:hypothetical protein